MRLAALTLILAVFVSLPGCNATSANGSTETKTPVKTTSSAPQTEDATAYEKITIQGDETLSGLFDLSLEYGPDGTGWMVYSRVSLPKYVSTHLAKSLNRGKTWTYVSTINQSHDETRKAKGKTFDGVWRYETPSLLYDAEDVANRRWKLFAQRVYVIPPFKKRNILFGKSWITYRTARSPQGPWSPESCLFGKVGGKCKLDLNQLDPSLEKVKFYNEIGTVVHDGVIYLSVDASTTSSGLGDWKNRRVVLFSSHDHCKTWRFVGTLTDFEDASDFGFFTFTGTSLVKENGRLYLLATPSGVKKLLSKNKGHAGTYVIEFEDISRAKLNRDASGKLLVVKKFLPEHHSGGLSDYDERNSYGGMIFSQINLDTKPEFFQIFSTKSTLGDVP